MMEMQTEPGLSAPRYDFDSIDLESGSVHANVVNLVGESRRILELGPATGYMSRAFSDGGGTVVAIEVDPAMAERAAEFCERMIIGDLDTLDLEAELDGEQFDAIVAADVLEHLKDPLDVLTRLRPFLKPDGCFVISVPNIAHGSVRLALLSGQFNYQPVGLLDSTHLRFFTLQTLEQLLDDAELGLAELHRHELNLDASEVPFEASGVSADVQAELEQDCEARTYQYVAKAIPMQRDGLREIQSRLRELAELRLANERLKELEKSFSEISGREGELRRALIDAHDQLLRREAEMQTHEENRDAEVESLRAEVDAVRAESMRLRVRLDRILTSPPGRIYAALRRLPGLRRVKQRREAGFDTELAKRTGQRS